MPEEEQGWLFAIARNQLYIYFRRGDVERGALQRAGLDGPSLTPADIEWAARLVNLQTLRTDIEHALDRLPADQAFAVSQRVLEDRSYKEIATSSASASKSSSPRRQPAPGSPLGAVRSLAVRSQHT